MNWLLPRLTAGVLAMLAGGFAGFMVSNVEHTVVWRVLAGGAIGVALAAMLDTARGYRLIEWLRGSQEQQAPRDAGFWGELGYRVERSIRLREQGLEQERLRLEQFLSAIEASPNGVLILDASEQIVWCNSVSADHFGLDPQRDRRQRVTNLVRSPAFVAYLQQQSFAEPVNFPNPRGDGTLSVTPASEYDGDVSQIVHEIDPFVP